MAMNTTTAPTHLQGHGDHSHSEPHVHGGPKMYLGILGALLFLTVVTVGASLVNFGSGMANVVIAMLIASIKASLVALFFMHLRWDKPMSAIIFCGTLFFLGLFLIGCYTDQIARPWLQPTNLKVPPAAVTPQGGQLAPVPAAGPAAPGGQGAPAGQVAPADPNPRPAIPGASPEGSHGGAGTGQTTVEKAR